MKIISLNVGKTQTVKYKNKTTRTAIFKTPSTKIHQVSFLLIDGDQQTDKRYHGGETKAVYSYDIAHYDYWKQALPRDDWNYGMFGENLTTQGLLESEVKIGNIYTVGSAKLQAMEPRFPCSKLNVRFNLSTMVKLFKQQKRNGIYFKVVAEGAMQMNDEIVLVEESPYNVTIQDCVNSFYTKGENKEMLHQLLSIPYLPVQLKAGFEAFL